MQVEELSAVRQTLQADLETSIRRIVDLQAALEEVESSDDSDSERYGRLAPRLAASASVSGCFQLNLSPLCPPCSVQTAVESFTRKRDL